MFSTMEAEDSKDYSGFTIGELAKLAREYLNELDILSQSMNQREKELSRMLETMHLRIVLLRGKRALIVEELIRRTDATPEEQTVQEKSHGASVQSSCQSGL